MRAARRRLAGAPGSLAAAPRPEVPTPATAEGALREAGLPRSATGRRDLALAGIPRSGSTLVCHLLNRFPDAVALHEPFSLSGFRRWPGLPVESGRALLGIEAFFADARASLRARGEAVSKQLDGEVPDNPIGAGGRGPTSLRTLARRVARRLGDGRSLRRGRVARGVLCVGKPLSEDFLLCVKHLSIFTALLPHLAERYPCFATVRNPVALLGSWNSVEFAVSEGRSRAAERLDPRLRRALARCADRGERQLRLLEWYFERIARWLPPARVLRYEDVVASQGALLARVAGTQAPGLEPLENRNRSADYDATLVLELGERLLRAAGAWSVYYSMESIERLLADIDAARGPTRRPASARPCESPAEAGAADSRGWP